MRLKDVILNWLNALTMEGIDCDDENLSPVCHQIAEYNTKWANRMAETIENYVREVSTIQDVANEAVRDSEVLQLLHNWLYNEIRDDEIMSALIARLGKNQQFRDVIVGIIRDTVGGE